MAKNLLTNGGTSVTKIPVELSYQIIKHFSAGLYTSPNKAIEELVANSYDAWARRVHVILSENLASPDAVVWVIDDGESMDTNDFYDLWRIGESRKRERGNESKSRPPIGKFGIGKLATYVLAKELTYVCKKERKYRAITMDFSLLETHPNLKRLKLSVRNLTIDEAKEALTPALNIPEDGPIPIPLFGADAPKTWTVAAMGKLTDMAKRITPGRLQRVLQTALPNNPQFTLYFGGKQLESQVISQPTISEWTIGLEDNVAEELDFESRQPKKGVSSVLIPHLGRAWGQVQLFIDPVSHGKAEDWGRSHGFFVMVRGRLINLHDELFGLEALSHGAFSRFRMVIHADGLDEYLRATRESVSENEQGVINLRKYIKSKFNEARVRWENWLSEQDSEKPLSNRVSSTPRSLSRQPLFLAIKRCLKNDEKLLLTNIPSGLDANQKEELLNDIERRIGEENFFSEVRFESLGMENGLAVFDVQERCIKVNIVHPFFANYSEHFHNPEPFQLIAVTEVLTEAYLLEERLSLDAIRHVLNRRDRFLRELVYSTQLAAPLVAELLDNNRGDSKGLEHAVYEGMRSLGFEVSKLGGSGKPDGLALARMGVREEGSGRSDSYKIAYDAKSSKNDRISAKDLSAATIKDHRIEQGADFSLVVAPSFEGGYELHSRAVSQAVEHNITLIDLEDFVKLVLAAATRPLPFSRLRDEFFKKCRGPQDAKIWMQKLLDENPPECRWPDILAAIWEMQNDSPDPPKFAAVRERLALKNEVFKTIREVEIREWMESVRRFQRELVTIEDDRVYVENPPEMITRLLLNQYKGLPKIITKGSMYSSLRAK